MRRSELVKAIFIFDKKSGRPYIRRTFGDFQAEPFLVMGFLNAIMKFAKEVGKSDLRMIDMQDLRFFFTEKNNIIFTSITTKIISPLDLKFKIKTIESIFLEKYTPENLANISLEIEFFESFIPVIDEIIFGDVRYLETGKRDQMQKLLNNLIKNENISGAAVLSFTGIILASVLSEKQKEIFFKFFNGIFAAGSSGLTRVMIDTQTYSLHITSLEEDCILIVFSLSKKFQNLDEKKISETILQVNELIA